MKERMITCENFIKGLENLLPSCKIVEKGDRLIIHKFYEFPTNSFEDVNLDLQELFLVIDDIAKKLPLFEDCVLKYSGYFEFPIQTVRRHPFFGDMIKRNNYETKKHGCS